MDSNSGLFSHWNIHLVVDLTFPRVHPERPFVLSTMRQFFTASTPGPTDGATLESMVDHYRRFVVDNMDCVTEAARCVVQVLLEEIGQLTGRNEGCN